MNQLRVRLRANHHRLMFPHAIAVLHELVPDLQTPEPDWVTVAEALEAVEPGGSGPPGFGWKPEGTLRPDDGEMQQHLATAQAFAGKSPGWLLQIPVSGNPAGLGRHRDGLALLQTPEFLRLLPRLFSDRAPTAWVRSWANPQEAAIDVDSLDPCCDGLSGYFIVLFHGHHDDTAPACPRTPSNPAGQDKPKRSSSGSVADHLTSIRNASSGARQTVGPQQSDTPAAGRRWDIVPRRRRHDVAGMQFVGAYSTTASD